jgi:hypothetical protein
MLAPGGTFQDPITQPVTYHHFDVSLVITCGCSPTRPLVIKSLEQIVECPECRRRFHVAVMKFNPRQGQPPFVGLAIEEPAVILPPR